jgi:signal peptidase II
LYGETGVDPFDATQHISSGEAAMPLTRKARYFWPLLLVLFLTDCATKDLALDRLTAEPGSHAVLDGVVRLSLAHNDGLAYGVDVQQYLGRATRPVLIVVISLLTVVLVSLYRTLNPASRLAGAALGLAVGGALGNLYDRVRFPSGVVDFIDVGVGMHRFWVFNVADVGITIGGVMLGVILLREEQRRSSNAD